VSHTSLDNTSILQLLAERFGRPGETYSSTVVSRAGTMASVSAVLSATAANTATASVTSPSLPAGAVPSQEGNANLRAAFSRAVQNLVAQHQAEALAKYPELSSQSGG
jgi:ABC-type phosphate transport system substrate-binding protein